MKLISRKKVHLNRKYKLLFFPLYRFDDIFQENAQWGNFYKIQHETSSSRTYYQYMGRRSTQNFNVGSCKLFQIVVLIYTNYFYFRFSRNFFFFFYLSKVIKEIKSQNLLGLSVDSGKVMLTGLKELQKRYPGLLHSARGIGTFCAIDCPNANVR